MTLSLKAIRDLRIALRKSYGESFDLLLSDEQIDNIGLLLLTGLVEGLKLKINSK